MNTFTKLKDGSWGVWVRGLWPEAGDKVQVSRKNKASKTVEILRVIKSWEDKSICTVVAPARVPSPWRYKGSIPYEDGKGGCWDEEYEDHYDMI